uniref:Cytochrome c oxidase subunit 7A1, mitochondrial n=1 Tax=Neogobius melanostomus TaxID=47308 RepID=A0A8C6WHV3_9GOBI
MFYVADFCLSSQRQTHGFKRVPSEEPTKQEYTAPLLSQFNTDTFRSFTHRIKDQTLLSFSPVCLCRSFPVSQSCLSLQKFPAVLSRFFSSSSRSLKNKVQMLKEDNGLPIHIKGGTVDVLLYRFTMTLTVAGSGYAVYWLLRAALPRGRRTEYDESWR